MAFCSRSDETVLTGTVVPGAWWERVGRDLVTEECRRDAGGPKPPRPGLPHLKEQPRGLETIAAGSREQPDRPLSRHTWGTEPVAGTAHSPFSQP